MVEDVAQVGTIGEQRRERITGGGVVEVAGDGDEVDALAAPLVVDLPYALRLRLAPRVRRRRRAVALALEMVDHQQERIAGGVTDCELRAVAAEDTPARGVEVVHVADD